MYFWHSTLSFILFIIDAVVKKNPKYKDIVRVKFEDEIFRAEVLEKCGEMYSVFLIDIGKNINVLADNIFELPNNLKNVTLILIFVLIQYNMH